MNSAPSSDSDDLDSLVTVRALARGEKVFGRYVVERILGRGGMGVVWLALDTELDQEVALKFLPDVVLGDHVARDDLKRETRRSRELTHQHIVRIHDFLRDERTAAISMEFIDGSTLSERRLALPQRIFEVEALVPWVRQLCEALDYAHTRPKAIVHRDLKPANLMVTTNGELKVTDFGIASSVSDSVSRVSRTVGSSGTPVYMSPQQMMGERPSVTDDVYAFGATIFELLTGKPPFYSGNVPLQVQTRVPPSVTERRRELEIEGQDLPSTWEELIVACLAKDPGSRPRSFRAIANQLQLGGPVSILDTEDKTIRSPGAAAAIPLDQMVTMVQSPMGTGADTASPAAPVAPPLPGTEKDGAPPTGALPGEATGTAAGPIPEQISGTTGAPHVQKKRSRKALKWVFGLAAVAAIAAGGIWWGDLYGRYFAAEASKQGAHAMQAGDWTGALLYYGRAASLRPSDAGHRRLLDQIQEEWMRELESELSGLPPEVVHERLQGPHSRTAMFLRDEYTDRFRQLVEDTTGKIRANMRAALARAESLAQRGAFDEADTEIASIEPYRDLLDDFDQEVDRVRTVEIRRALEAALASADTSDFEQAFAALNSVKPSPALESEYDATVKKVREAQVRQEINAALARSASGDFENALDALAATEQRGILSSEIAAAREQIRAALVREEIGTALARSAQGDFDSALEQLEATAGRGSLPGEVVSARTQVREARARAEIDQALARLSAGDFEGALERLDATGKRGVLAAEVEAARTTVRETQVRQEIELAMARSEDGDFAGAISRLDATGKRGVLAAEVEAARTTVRETQVRQEIEFAMARLEDGDFAGAVTRLEAAERRGLLLSEIADARAQVRRKGEATSIGRLPPAIMAGNATEVQAIIDDFSTATGEKFHTSAQQLLGETDLDGYLRALEELQLRPSLESERKNRLDHVLVEAQRARFGDQKAVTTFIGKSYASWARDLLAEKQFESTLYVVQRARAEGVDVDAALERSALAGLIRDFGFRLLVARPEADRQTPAVLQTQPLDSLRSRLSSELGEWMPLGDATISSRTGSDPTAFVLRTSVRGVDTQNDRREEARYARYQSGWNTFANPEYANLAAQLDDAEYKAREAVAANAQNQQQVRDASSNRDLDNTTAVLFGITSGLSTISVAAAQGEVRRLREQLAGTPRTVREPVYANEPYSVITHNLTYSAEFAAEIDWQGNLLGLPQRFQATTTHQTVEINGNTARGVPVRRPQYPDSAGIARGLASDLARQVTREADTILTTLADGTFRALESLAQDRKTSAAEVVDRRWGLLQLWNTSGVKLPPGDLERTVREHLGLPEAIHRPIPVKKVTTDSALAVVPVTVSPAPTKKGGEPKKTEILPVVTMRKTPEGKIALETIEPDVYNARDLDKLPQPTSRKQPVLSRAQRRGGVSGTIVLSFIVDTRGRVQDVKVVRTDRKELERPAIEAVLKWRFKPGLKGSKKVKTRVQQSFVFK